MVIREVNSSPDSSLCKLMHGEKSLLFFLNGGSGDEQHSEGKVVHLQDNLIQWNYPNKQLQK